jgi:hypothetical protein
MPRDGSQIYHRPPGTDGVPNYTVESARYNAFTADVEQDLNLPRPVIAGGTGATNKADAMTNLGGELSAQLIVNYNSDPFQAGSFYSAAGATGAPTANAFTGICYAAVITGSVTTDLFIEARDQVTGNLFVRQKKANVWQAWAQAAGVTTGATPPSGVSPNTLWWDPTRGKLFIYYQDVDSAQWVEAVAVPDLSPNNYVRIIGETMTGPLILSGDPTLPLGSATKQYVDAGDTANSNNLNNRAVRYDAAQTLTDAQQLQARQNISALMRSYLAGLTLSTPGSSTSFTVQPGVAMDSSNAVLMLLNAAITKTSAAWAVGAGGALDTGTIANSTWYHVYLIRRPDTGVVDVLLSLSATAPTLPANYTQFRRIGSMKYGSAQWFSFNQVGDEFMWVGPVNDIFGVSAVGGAGFAMPSVPPGITVKMDVTLAMSAPAAAVVLYVDHFAGSASAGVTAGYSVTNPVANQAAVTRALIWTAAQNIHLQSNATASIYVTVFGWIDRRGRDA